MSEQHGNPYDALGAGADGGGRWAFGTGFAGPPDGVPGGPFPDDPFSGGADAGPGGRVPAGLDPDALARYCLALADDALVYSHRLQQWLTRLPELEEETAVANIALDLLGQARLLLARAGAILGRTEDDLAFFRDSAEFRNVRFAERADRDFAELTGRLLIFSAWRLELFQRLSAAPDPALAAIAAKGAIELTYHRDYAARWVVRLGDGTPESGARMRAALAALWPGIGELFLPDPDALAVAAPAAVDAVLGTVLAAAALDRPGPASGGGAATAGDARPDSPPGWGGGAGASGRAGDHSPALAEILAELQSVARAHPDATW